MPLQEASSDTREAGSPSWALAPGTRQLGWSAWSGCPLRCQVGEEGPPQPSAGGSRRRRLRVSRAWRRRCGHRLLGPLHCGFVWASVLGREGWAPVRAQPGLAPASTGHAIPADSFLAPTAGVAGVYKRNTRGARGAAWCRGVTWPSRCRTGPSPGGILVPLTGWCRPSRSPRVTGGSQPHVSLLASLVGEARSPASAQLHGSLGAGGLPAVDVIGSPALALGPLVTAGGVGRGALGAAGPGWVISCGACYLRGSQCPPLQPCTAPSLCLPSPESGGRAGRSQPRSRQACCGPGVSGAPGRGDPCRALGTARPPSLATPRPLGGCPSPSPAPVSENRERTLSPPGQLTLYLVFVSQRWPDPGLGAGIGVMARVPRWVGCWSS